jgi:hypothetical protein
MELIGVSDWEDNASIYQQFSHNFLVVTHAGQSYYLSCSSAEEKDSWMTNIKAALECMFANPLVMGYKPNKILHSRPSEYNRTYTLCAKTGSVVVPNSAAFCISCSRCFSSAEFVQEYSTAIQIQIPEAVRMCSDCKKSQSCVLWLKNLNYMHILALNEEDPAVLRDVNKFKASFKLRRKVSPRLEMAGQLLDQGSITLSEFEDLRAVDHNFR